MKGFFCRYLMLKPSKIIWRYSLLFFFVFMFNLQLIRLRNHVIYWQVHNILCFASANASQNPKFAINQRSTKFTMQLCFGFMLWIAPVLFMVSFLNLNILIGFLFMPLWKTWFGFHVGGLFIIIILCIFKSSLVWKFINWRY